MGVELALYRVRIGKFVHRHTGQGLSNIDYLLKAIASVRHGLVRSCRCQGTVPFIDLLLLAQGVEPNPGPGVKDHQVPQSASNNGVENPRPSNSAGTSNYTGEATRSHVVGETASTYDVDQSVESTHMSTEAPCSESLMQVKSSAPKQEIIYLRDPERDQQEEMEYTEDTTSPKIPQPEGDTDNRGYQKRVTLPFLQSITAGGSGPETGHLSGEAVGKMVLGSPQGGTAGAMMHAHPQGGTAGTMMPTHPQGGTSTTLVQVKKQKIGTLNVSFLGGEANVLGDNNTVTINKTEIVAGDDTKFLWTEIKEQLSRMEQSQKMPPQKPQKTSGTQTSAAITSKESSAKQDKTGKEEKDKEVLVKRKHLEEAAEATIGKFVYDSEEVLVERSEGVKAVIQCLKNYNMVVITGVTGEGKTTLAAQILKGLRDGRLDTTIEAKSPIQMFIPEDWTTVVGVTEDVVVFVDDIFGTSNYQVDLLNRWQPIFRAIDQCLEKKKVMLVLTSRTHILRDARRDTGVTDENNDHILSEKKTVDITNKYQLTSEEQQNMLGNYSVLYKREVDFKYRISLQTLNRAIGFPQVCSLFFNDPQLYEKGQTFFEHPDRLLESEIKKMSKCEPHKYFALVYCFLQHNQRVHSRDLDPLHMSTEEREMLKRFAEICGVECNNHTALLKKALSSLTRTYLSCNANVYTFSHESVAENVCLVFGSEHPKITLEKCSSRVILELLDLSQTGQPNLPHMQVPETCYDALSQRIYKMVTKGHLISWENLTLESFSRFQKQTFADHFFAYLSKHKLIKDMITVHDKGQSSLLSACANNVAFLSAIYRSNVDIDMINQHGALHFTACVQKALHQAIEHKNAPAIELLLNQGAVFDTTCLSSALRFRTDQDVTQTVLSGTIWTTSELKDEVQEISKRGVASLKQRLCNIKPLHIGRQQEQPKQTRNDVKREERKSSSFRHMLSELLATAPNSEKRQSILKAILDSKDKKLSDIICIRRILGSFDAALIQYALQRCDTDTVRFLVLSSKLTNDQLDALLSQQVHFGHLTIIEILCRAGGRLSVDDFIQRAGSCGYGVSETVNIMATFGQFSADTLSDALKSALCSGSKHTIQTLLDHRAKYEFDQDTIHKVVCRRDLDIIQMIYTYIDKAHVSVALNAAVRSGLPILVKNLSSRGGKFTEDAMILAVCRTSEVFEMVKLVSTTASRQWSPRHFTRALAKAVEICRSDVVEYLNKQGGQFGTDSLQNVLEWNVEHHVQAASIRYILSARNWSEHDIQAALVAAVDMLFVTRGGGKANWSAFVALMLYKEKNVPCELKHILDIIKILEKQKHSKVLVHILNRSVKHGRVDVAAYLIETGTVCGDDCLVDSVCSERIQGRDRLKMVRLVHTSRHWSDRIRTEALDKALECGHEDIVKLLHMNGAKFGDKSLVYAIPASCHAHDSFSLVTYILAGCKPSHTAMSAALVKSIDCCYYQLMVDLHSRGAKFPDGSLMQIVCKRWKPVDRLKAVEYLCKSRQWTTKEMQKALFETVKFGDIQTARYIASKGAPFFDGCLAEAMEKKMKPSHRLCMIKLIISGQSISQIAIIRARIKADTRSEAKIVAFLQQFNTA